MEKQMKPNDHLFGIITRFHHHHGKRVHRPALRASDDRTGVKEGDGLRVRARWYGNYGMFRYAMRMAASYKVGGRSEFNAFFSVYQSRTAMDILEQRRMRRSFRTKTINTPAQ